jgi:hypothetical protein
VKTIEQILHQLADGEFELTRHALRRIVERNISESEICQAAKDGRVIEDYPDDKYSPQLSDIGFYSSRTTFTHSGIICRNGEGENHHTVRA